MEDTLAFRPGNIQDSEDVGRIMYEAFLSIADQHRFPPDFSSLNEGIKAASSFLNNHKIYSVVAEVVQNDNKKIVGSNFLDERSKMVAGVGPITIDPMYQNKGLGRKLMIDVINRASNRNYPSVRLLQASYHNRSLSLYTNLGFSIREPISTMQGKPIQKTFPGRFVREAKKSDINDCNLICKAVHGHDRSGELEESIDQGMARVVLHEDQITGYTTGLTFFNHSIGINNTDIMALIGSESNFSGSKSTLEVASTYGGPGILIPSRNTELLRWCFNNGLKLVQQLTLMTIGLYNEPTGSYMPSVLY